jgi:hypothetical protein
MTTTSTILTHVDQFDPTSVEIKWSCSFDNSTTLSKIRYQGSSTTTTEDGSDKDLVVGTSEAVYVKGGIRMRFNYGAHRPYMMIPVPCLSQQFQNLLEHCRQSIIEQCTDKEDGQNQLVLQDLYRNGECDGESCQLVFLSLTDDFQLYNDKGEPVENYYGVNRTDQFRLVLKFQNVVVQEANQAVIIRPRVYQAQYLNSQNRSTLPRFLLDSAPSAENTTEPIDDLFGPTVMPVDNDAPRKRKKAGARLVALKPHTN